ncbi:putative MFS family arabinose efflux permease [Kitasatospora sp. MAP12-15]|uniref:MFS transporter n=1 Tax=unclassified Kitasatospora TaxID=2633591 RepID=UPI0024756B07|nr:MFS transporter [Kitasatospora sp. MAP12-44]MDH6114528.1 putative MFS family arabinose efflux permease [Kitasatospora sp. MAP12-44]
MNRRLTALLAATSAVTAANIYLSQPLLTAVAGSLHVGPQLLGAVPTATQLGYAAGIALLVPAGDSHDRRRLILWLCAASCLALAGAALACGAGVLVVASFAIGLLSPVPQLVVPLALALSMDGSRGGRTVGVLQGGLLLGVLTSRTYSGALAAAAGWRSVYWCSCVATLLLTLLLWRALPSALPGVPRGAAGRSYHRTLASLPRLFAAHPLVRRVTLSGALVGVSFGAFWTALTFLLEQRYHYGSTGVGLFGLVAAAGALASPAAGRLADRLGPRGTPAVLIAIVLAGWAVLLPGGHRLGWLAAGTVLLDVGTWGNQVACQSALFTLDPAIHSRLNTCYFTLRFLGIAIGSTAGTLAWQHGGWRAVAGVGVTAGVAALLVAVLPDRRPGAGAQVEAGDDAVHDALDGPFGPRPRHPLPTA